MESLLNKRQFHSVSVMLENAKKGLVFSRETIEKVRDKLCDLSNKENGFYSVIELLVILYEISLDKNARTLTAGTFTNQDDTSESRRIQKVLNYMRLLRSQLYELELEKRRTAQAKVEAGKKKIEWGSQIRSYVFDDRRVKDHRTNYQTSNVQAVMDGDIDAFIKAYLMEFPD